MPGRSQEYLLSENADEYVLIEIDENMPQEELIKFAQELNQESEVVENSVPVVEPVQKEPSKRKRCKCVYDS